MQPVVVGMEATPGSLDAVDLAADEAVARRTSLVVVHAQGQRPQDNHFSLDAVLARARTDRPGLTVGGRLLAGDPARTLVAQARRACLLVVRHRRDSRFPALPAGTVAARVAHEAEAPVLVHRPIDRRRNLEARRPVLVVGVDGLARSEPVIEFAFAEAAWRGATLLGVHVCAGPDPAAADRLSAAIACWSAKYPEVPVRRVVRRGEDVARELTRASHHADLVVVGSPRHGGMAPGARGLTSQALIDLAGCPVAVVPQP
jgi:nucleotide-binding universal stress UspA family protein